MKTKRIGYWIITTTLALALLSGGFAGLIQRPENVEFMTHLGYPVYSGMIIGFWKVLGGVAILSPGFPRLKEWAYAGIFFNMTGAATSHVFAGDAAWHVVVPAAFALLAVASWALRPSNRRHEVIAEQREDQTVGLETQNA